jgi:hypothetical protein
MAVGLPDESSDVSVSDLRRLTNELIDETRRLLRRCTDEDISFVPEDPYAFDPGATTDHEANMAWTLGHIIVHMTASSEEFAAVAAELARGVAYHGRSRHEVPWEAGACGWQAWACGLARRISRTSLCRGKVHLSSDQSKSTCLV